MQILPSPEESITCSGPHYDRAKEAKELTRPKPASKASSTPAWPRSLGSSSTPPQNLRDLSSDTEGSATDLKVPIIDMMGCQDSQLRRDVVDDLRRASETWGFFQIINHGIPVDVMDGVLEAVKQFHEQPEGVKGEWYSRDDARKFRYYSNGDLFWSKAATWKDTLLFDFLLEPDREARHWGLDSGYLGDIECMDSKRIVSHYYPTCPQPELTLGTINHSDATYLTLLLQNHHGGLQVRQQDQWVDVSPVPGAILANIGDLMQLVSNDKFKSVEHRVLARRAGPRVSVLCFLFPGRRVSRSLYGPIKELSTRTIQPMYRRPLSQSILGITSPVAMASMANLCFLISE
ncbi:1-aminocyclopropane-1-carboxylate oxidase homolog 1 [Eucalyptus grandis]|uniref:1-aminocyclopropane-1-carboxylate oxidase homolog 1 n=1 Tax=Eucalyptus grandis TaxID=71139 RepID=UPI00192EFF37|nr:1-aminocyclopropane-1-carboxylate oxidase homolog 1 [Eucalyptus grandis]